MVCMQSRMGLHSEGSGRCAHALLTCLVALWSWPLCVTSAVAQDPRRPVIAGTTELAALRQRAEARAARGDRQGAIEAYGQVLRRASDDARSLGARGKLLLELGRYDAARVDLTRAADEDPALVDYRVWLGDACRAQGDRRCATEAYLSVLSSPGSACS